jgi:hypothetical protein
MISAVDLFGRSTITSIKRKRLKAANITASSIYEKRTQAPYCEYFTEQTSLEDVEDYLVRVLQTQYQLRRLQRIS